MDARNRCPNCGRFIADEPDGYYAKTSNDEFAAVEVFCGEPCHRNFVMKQINAVPALARNQAE